MLVHMVDVLSARLRACHSERSEESLRPEPLPTDAGTNVIWS